LIDWILANKDWLFSGLGLSLLAFLFYLIRRLSEKLRSAPPPFDQAQFRTRPLPDEISRRVEVAPPLHQANRSSEFTGLRVQWRTTLSASQPTHDGKILLMLLDRGKYPWIRLEIDAQHYPDLQLARKGTTIWVAGTIAGYHSNTFTISEPQLKVLLPEAA
jgi:hypothetical protein